MTARILGRRGYIKWNVNLEIEVYLAYKLAHDYFCIDLKSQRNVQFDTHSSHSRIFKLTDLFSSLSLHFSRFSFRMSSYGSGFNGNDVKGNHSIILSCLILVHNACRLPSTILLSLAAFIRVLLNY